MKALSIKQPWAWLICVGFKDIENRNWRIGREPSPGYHSRDWKLTLPCRIYIHASKSWDGKELSNALFNLTAKQKVKMIDFFTSLPTELFFEKYLGAIIGEVDIVDCVTASKSPWFTGKYGFVLRNPVIYEVPIPCRGSLGFFKPDIDFLRIAENVRT